MALNSLLSLPPEIRVNIYQVCLSGRIFETLSEVPPLLRTCRTIRAEALDVLDNHGLLFPTINRLYAFLRAIGRARRARLRRLAFCYAVRSGDADNLDKWADIELVKRAFRLLRTECRNLRTLSVHVCQRHMARDLGAGNWNMTRERKHEHHHRDIAETQGLLELGRLRGLREVLFVPYDSQPLRDDNRQVLQDLRVAMLEPQSMRKSGSRP